MEQYDEDLSQNPFFENLKTKHTQLFDTAAEKRWIILIPRVGSLSDLELTVTDFENHIIVAHEDDQGDYKTLSNKAVSIQSNIITTGAGFPTQRLVPILFEETYFNKSDKSYRVICINQPLEGGDDCVDYMPDRPVYSYSSRSAEECANLLWGTAGNHKTRKQLGDLIDNFQKNLDQMRKSTLKQLLATTKTFFDKALAIVMRDPHMKRSSWKDVVFQDSVKLAVETHLMYGVHKRLFRLICTCQAGKDAQLNKITRNLSHIQLQDLGVRLEFCQNVPRARKELSNLSLHRTPIGKLNCFKRVVGALTKAGPHSTMAEPIPLTTDDLLPILVFLVLKADIPNWCSHFQHMTSFRFSRSGQDDEYGFYLATLEAAIEHVNSGSLLDLDTSHSMASQSPAMTSPSSPEKNLWQRLDQDNAAVEQLFKFVRDRNKAAVLEILRKSKSRRSRGQPISPQTSHQMSPPVTHQMSPPVTHQVAPPVSPSNHQMSPVVSPVSPVLSGLCHPLCSCERCRQLQQAKGGRSPVTVNSRDARGYTALHVAAFYGHVEVADILLQQGALVNGTDVLNQTPLHTACRKGHQHVTLLLLNHGAMVNSQDGEGNTALHYAALNGHDDCAKALVFFDQGLGELNLDATNDFGDTPLHLATKWGYYNLVDLLLENGASALSKNRKHYEPLRYAYSGDIADRINLAMIEEIQVNIKKKEMSFEDSPPKKKGQSPTSLPKRIITSTSETPKEKSATHQPSTDVFDSNSLPSSPTPRAIRANTLPPGADILTSSTLLPVQPPAVRPDSLARSMSEVILHRNNHMEPPRRGSESRLSLSGGHLLSQKPGRSRHQSLGSVNAGSPGSKKVEKLLRSVADGDINMAKFHLGWTSDSEDEWSDLDLDLSKGELCHPLCQCKKCQRIQKFTSASARSSVHVNSQDLHGYSPVHVAAHNSHVTLLELFLRRGGNPNIATHSQGTTPLHMACKQHDIRILECLLQYRADVNSSDVEGNTPLHYCCMLGNERKARLLIKNGADVNLPNKKGNTPMHDTVRWNFINVARLLLKAGATVQSRNIDHKLPLQYAQTDEMCKLLRQHFPVRSAGHTSPPGGQKGDQRLNIQIGDDLESSLESSQASSLGASNSYSKPGESDVYHSGLSAGTPDTRQSADVPNTRLSADVPDTKLSADAPNTRQSADVPNTKLSADVPDTRLSAGTPNIRLSAGTPDTIQSADVPDIRLSSGIPDTKLSADVPDMNPVVKSRSPSKTHSLVEKSTGENHSSVQQTKDLSTETAKDSVFDEEQYTCTKSHDTSQPSAICLPISTLKDKCSLKEDNSEISNEIDSDSKEFNSDIEQNVQECDKISGEYQSAPGELPEENSQTDLEGIPEIPSDLGKTPPTDLESSSPESHRSGLIVDEGDLDEVKLTSEESDSISENSNTESQQDFSLD